MSENGAGRLDVPRGRPAASPAVPHSVDRQRELFAQGLRKAGRVGRGTPLDEDKCPYCLTGLNPGDRVVLCPVCGMAHHAECWGENEGCCSYGCLAAPIRTLVPVPPPAPRSPSLSPPAAAPPWGEITCNCGNVLNPDDGHCSACGRSRAEIRPGHARPRTPGVVADYLAQHALEAAVKAFAIAVAIGALAGMSSCLSNALGLMLLIFAALHFFKYATAAVHDATDALAAIRRRPYERGRGKAMAALLMSLLAVAAAVGVGLLMRRLFGG